jgi:hypothetical protein
MLPLCRHAALVLTLAIVVPGCGASANTTPPPPCDQACRDGVAIKALREGMKLVFNLTLQGKPVGQHDVTVPCPLGGKARVFGEASSNAVQGATEVKLTYVLDACGYSQKDNTPRNNHALTATGTVTQFGTLAVQPTATTALVMKSDAITLKGTVYDPPLDYDEKACPLALSQSGNQLSGTVCGRQAGTGL